MRYSEIINEDNKDITITSKKALKNILSYGEVKLPPNGVLIIDIEEPYSIIFPPKFTVYGRMEIMGGIEKITGDLTVHGYLDVGDTYAQSLPEKLRVEGFLNLESTLIKSLPLFLYVGGDLYVAESALNNTAFDIVDNSKTSKVLGNIVNDWGSE